MTGNIGDVSRLLSPKSVAIIGASDKPGSLGASVLHNLERLGFKGDIHLVNPKRDEIAGRRCVKTPSELPEGIDAAVLAIPRAFVLETIKALAERGCGAAVIFSAGFAEAGEEGLAEQAEIGRIARSAGMVVEGPNCLGCVNYVDQTSLTFVEAPTPKLENGKGIAIVSQSGAMAAVLSSNLTARQVALSYSVSTGNEAASGVEDYVAHLLDDPYTNVIAMIVEQFRDPSRMLSLAAEARRKGLPIVLLHPGRSEAAAESAATHTGAMAGDYKVMQAKVEHAGIILVETLEELGDVAEIAARAKRWPAGGCAVLTESGAFKAMTMDLCSDVGLALPVLTDENAPSLREAMPEFVGVSNPVDMTAQALIDPDMYRRTLDSVVNDDRFGSVVLAIIQTDHSTAQKKFPPIIDALRQLETDKPVIVCGIDEGGIVDPQYVDGVRQLGVPYYPSAERVFRALSHLSAHGERMADGGVQTKSTAIELPSPGVIPEYAAKEILSSAGIPFPPSRMATSPDEAVLAAEALGYPVVLKAQSSALSHKSDAGGVIVGLDNAEAVQAGWSQMIGDVKRYKDDLTLDGILVEGMGNKGVELIIGARNEPGWGPVILAGFGGVQAELYQDVCLIPPGLTEEQIVEKLLSLTGAPLLTGFRGAPAVDLTAVADIITKVGAVMTGNPSIREIDLNPVVAYRDGMGALPLDALILNGNEQSG